MTWRVPLLLPIVIALAFATSQATDRPAAAERPPNVVLIIADDKYLEPAAAKQKCRIFGTFSAKILVCELAPTKANSGRLVWINYIWLHPDRLIQDQWVAASNPVTPLYSERGPFDENVKEFPILWD